MNKVLVFSHIPKTAGTSINYLLNRYFGTSKLDAILRKNNKSLEYTPIELKKDICLYSDIRLLAGHSIKPFINFGEFEQRMSWFTFLRNPVKRYLSHYIHQQTNDYKRYNMPLFDWAKRYNRKNWMVKMIAGEENLSKAIEYFDKKIEFTGLTESFDESMIMFKNKYQLSGFDLSLPQQKMTIRNTHIRDEIYDDYAKYEDLLMNENRLDIELYDYVKKNIWPTQQHDLLFTNNDKLLTANKQRKNIFYSQIKRNLIYKPFVSIDNAINTR